ncbi:DMT family transporter [Clostridium aminobutyricum]|uniref:DMT family transporter n=1 Tax=Clostridium aminobutyricum TaxID=33953 RepID=A0A939D9V9_CLOAM|nr:DMT family transporter [Clostridium aminobutyricum]MBN7773896.1 DMT family transporter [Clostridium aminobutyricum]
MKRTDVRRFGGEIVNELQRERKITCFLMVLLVTGWGLEYVVAKKALEVLEPLSLLFFKYLVGFLVVWAIKLKQESKIVFNLKDFPIFILCAITGEIFYFYCEYSAMSYMPISLITIILAFVPGVSMIIERIVYKKKASRKMLIGLLFCILGVAFVIGVDFKILLKGRIIGYLLVFAAIFSWNAYNFVTASLRGKYSDITLTFNQLLCTILLTFPYAVQHRAPIEVFTPDVIGGIIYLGVFTAGLGFIIQVKSLYILGPTTTSLFSNFMPIAATFFGWIFLKESISLLQIIGGIVVISAGYVVVKEKGKMEELSNESES